MRKKFLVLALAAVVTASSLPAANISASTISSISLKGDSDDEASDAEELTKGYIIVSPAKKTIKVGQSFEIDLYPSEDFEEEYGDLPDEEWEELLENNIDDITYRSTNSSVAYVNRAGKVKGQKKGNAIVKTTVTFRDGSQGIYKTKVYVTK